MLGEEKKKGRIIGPGRVGSALPWDSSMPGGRLARSVVDGRSIYRLGR